MDDIVERLRESALEDAKCGWYDPAPRYTARSMLLDQAADTIDRQREEIGRLRHAIVEARIFITNFHDDRYKARALNTLLVMERAYPVEAAVNAALSYTTRGK